jgi:hypothetical protein
MEHIRKLYIQLPVQGVTYVIRDIRLGIHHPGRQGDISLLLIGLVNPKSNSRAALERGFSETRFRPLDELHTRNTQKQPDRKPAKFEPVES